MFLWLFLNNVDVLNIWSVLPILLVTGIIVALITTSHRQYGREKQFGHSVRDEIVKLLSQVEHWIWMIKIYIHWIFIPGICVWIATVGWQIISQGIREWMKWYIPLSLVLYGFIYWIVRRILQKKYVPRKRHLESILHSLEASSEHE